MGIIWLFWVPLISVCVCLVFTRGAAAPAALWGFGIACIAGLAVAGDIYRSDGAWQAVWFWLYHATYWAWLAAGIGAVRAGWRHVGTITLGVLAGYVFVCLTLLD